MSITLKITKSPEQGIPVGAERNFKTGEFTLGRATDCTWPLTADLDLSRHHCKIVSDNNTYAIIDTKCANGLWVNGDRLASEQCRSLADGDSLTLGRYEIVVRLEKVAAAPLKTSPEPAADDIFADFKSGAGSEPDSGDRSTDDENLERDRIVGPDIPIDQPVNFNARDPKAVEEEDSLSVSVLLDGFKPEPDNAQPRAVRKPVVQSQRSADQPQTDALVEFLKGVGIERKKLRDVDPDKCLRLAGETYRQAVSGICEVLKARAEFKDAFRVEQTRIAAAENNPLKVSDSVEQALLKMLTPGNAGFKRPPDAMREALNDIKIHQLALIAAIQVALTGVLEQIDPKALEARLGPSIMHIVPGSKKVQLWEAYEALHAEIAEEITEDFRGTLGRAFAEAYEKYISQK